MPRNFRDKKSATVDNKHFIKLRFFNLLVTVDGWHELMVMYLKNGVFTVRKWAYL